VAYDSYIKPYVSTTVPLLGALAKFRKATTDFVTSVCQSAWNNSVPTGRILTKLDIWAFLQHLSRKFKFHYNPKRITGTLHEDVFTFITIYRWILLSTRNVSNKSCSKNQNTYFTFNNFFLQSCRLWENVEKCGRAREAAHDNLAARCMLDNWGYMPASTCQRPYTHTHPHMQVHTQKYVILIALPQQPWFREIVSCYVIRTLPVLFFWTWNELQICRQVVLQSQKRAHSYYETMTFITTYIHDIPVTQLEAHLAIMD
jgi:hypothetical protein